MTTPLSTPARVFASVCPSFLLAAEVYSRFREPRQVTCPENGKPATVEVDADLAAATALVGMTELRITRCTEWPRGCGRGCLCQLSNHGPA
jgi:hypothetical protein